MMTTLKVIPIGNSAGIILPKEMLAQLNLQKGDDLHFSVTESGFQLSPYDPELAEDMLLLRDVLRRDRDVLRMLAQ
jgi:putative addiction module antidote